MSFVSETSTMFFLLGGEQPTKRVNLEYRKGNTLILYMATRTKEIMHVYENEVAVASFYRALSLVKVKEPTESATEKPPRKEVLKVAGPKWKEYKEFMGVQSDIPCTAYINEFVPGTSKSLTQLKEFKYEIESLSTAHVLQKVGNSVEDYLYELRSLQSIAESKVLNLDWVNRKNYRVLTSREDIEAFIEGLRTTTEIVGFDTETTGLLVGREKIDILVGISMSYEDHTGVYFPLQHRRFPNVEMGQNAFLDMLKPYIHRHSEHRKELVTHNGGFDWKTLKMHDIDLNIVYDTFIRQGLKEISAAKNIGSLKEIAKHVLGHDVVELEDMYENRTKQDVKDVQVAVFEKGLSVNDITRYKLERAEEFNDLRYDFRFVDYEFARVYGSADADFPRLIHKIQDQEWDKELDFIYRLEINLIPVLGEQEYFGVRGRQDEFVNLLNVTQARVDSLRQEIYRMVGYEFNLSSGPQKAKVIYEDLGCPILKRFRTKKGGLKTDAATLKTLASYKNDDGTPRYPVIPLIQRYTKLNTLISNFYGKLPKLLHNGFFFPSYKQLGTETGRISCSKPNLQQTEPTSRKYMVPDTEDHYFLICDYSQVEYRVMAGMSGEQKVVDFFANNPEADYHILAYANMMGKAYEDVTSEERGVGKVLNFGTTYGLEDEALALALLGDSTPYHQQLARQKREQYFAGVPILRDYFEAIRDEAQEKGYVRTLFKRVRHIPEFNYKGFTSEYTIQSGRRKAGNMPVQGTAADIMKIAMVRVHRAIRKAGFTEDQMRLVMNIHDELVLQVHKSINMWYALTIVRKAMEIDMSAYGFPPLYIGANVGYTWFDGKIDELEAPVLLMDEKIAEVEAKLAAGEELEVYEDPRTVWENEISLFALKQVRKEIEENNLTTMDECYKNIRVMKYARHFTTKRRIEKDGVEEMKKYSFDNNIISLLLDRSNTVESVWEQLPDLLENMPIIDRVVETKEAVQLPETETGLLAVLREHIQVNRQTQTIHLHLNSSDSNFLAILDSLMIDLKERYLYKLNQDLFKVHVNIPSQQFSHMLPTRVFMGECIVILKDLMVAHLFTGEYNHLRNQASSLKSSLKLDLEEHQSV